MAVYSEEIHTVNIGNGLYTAELAASIPDGYVPEAFNLIATGETLENRLGFKQTTIDFKEQGPSFGFHAQLFELVQFNPDWPILAFAYGSEINFIRSSANFVTGTPSGDGFMNVNPAVGDVYGICQYNDRTYFSTSTGVHAITAYNWTADSITHAPIVGSPTGLFGIFSFKGRLWGWGGDKLYFTEVVSVGGPYPETWNFTTNFVPMREDRGSGVIFDVVPLSNKLIVFTSAGAFTLLVEGTPSSWVKRTLDIKSSSTRQGCAFEAQGIVYYVNTTGVYATDGLTTVKISSTIDDRFSKPNNSLRHSLHYFEDGMIMCISKYFKDGAGLTFADSSASELFYTRLDPIAWTQWGLQGNEDYPSEIAPFQFSDVFSTASGVNTFLSLSPISLMIATVGESTEADPAASVYQLLLYDGHEDTVWTWDGSNFVSKEDTIKVHIGTRFTDAGASVKLKRVKQAYLEAYTSDANHAISTKFYVNDIATAINEREVTEPSVGENVNLIKIPCRAHFRRIAANVSSYLQSADSQLKFKAIHLILHTNRNETDDAS